VVAGTNISIDNTDPDNPVVSAPDVAVKSSDSGTTGLVLKGATGGTYTIGTQSWEWSRVGNQVTFRLFINAVDGSDPTGDLQLDMSGTTIPSIAPNQFFNVYITGTFSVSYYSILAKYATNRILSFPIQTALDGTNATLAANVDIS